MTIFALDDEPLSLALLRDAIAQAAPDARVVAFSDARAALREIERGAERPEILFTDVEMPGMTGLELAARVREASRGRVNVIFVTAYADYALNAVAMHASGYVLKPYDPEAIRREIGDLRYPVAPLPCRVRAQCFGFFEVLVDGAPPRFRYAKTRELLAYLIDRRGGPVNAEEICLALWESAENSRALRSQLRNLVADLRRALRAMGAEELLRFSRNSFAVRPEKIDCDFYRFLRGEDAARRAFTGEYMCRYSWAEATLGALAAQTEAGVTTRT